MPSYDPDSEEHRAWANEAQARMYQDFMRAQRAGFNNQGHRPNVPPPRPQFAAIPPDMLKRLIMLCHPDKHDNSEMSKTVTQWLLKQRL